MASAEIVILGKTYAGTMLCIGGMDLMTATAMRLTRKEFPFWKTFDGFEIGQVYEIRYADTVNMDNPHHVEDVIVFERKHVRDMGRDEIVQFLRERDLVVKSQDPREAFRFESGKHPIRFDGKTGKFSMAQVDAARLMNSVGHWEYPRDLTLRDKRYHGGNFSIKYVGYETATPVIEAGTIVRLSTSSLWSRDGKTDLKSFMQVSGWF